eukprot:XP_020397016.1 CASP-like protein 4B1 [Zea mays]
MAMVTIDNAAATIAAAEKPQDAEKPDYAPITALPAPQMAARAPASAAAAVAAASWTRWWRGGGGGHARQEPPRAAWRGAVFALVALVYRCPNSAGRPFGPVARHEFSPVQTRSGTVGYGPGRHGRLAGRHGGWMQFDRYEEYRYLLAIVSLGYSYSLAQAVRRAYRMRGGADPVSSASGRPSRFRR